MKYVLLFCVWLTLCYSSLSASETPVYAQKDLRTSICGSINSGKSKKASIYNKIKLNFTKVRMLFSQSILPDLPLSIKTKHALPVVSQTIGWSIFEKSSYQYIFSYLYSKHAFW